MVAARMRVLLGVSLGVLSGSVPLAAPNQAPAACFTVSPDTGTVETIFIFDAGCSTDDDKTPANKLRFRWDWESDGIWDTKLTTEKSANHQYASEGPRTIRLEVRDAQELKGSVTHDVVVMPVVKEALVGEPEQLPGATEPDVDVDPVDPRRIAISAHTSRFGEGAQVPFPAFFSTDGGASWTRSEGPSPSRSGDTALEFDSEGRLFLSAIDVSARGRGPLGVVVARSGDGGRTFPEATSALDASTVFTFPDGSERTLCGSEGSFFDFPRLAADKSPTSPYRNHLYLTAMGLSFDLDGDGSCESAAQVFLRSADSGKSWDGGQVIPGMRQFTGAIGIAPDGTIYLADPTVNTPFCRSGTGIALRKSVDGGAGFLQGTCAFASDAAFRPGMTWTAADPADANRVYVAFSATVSSLGSSDHVYVIGSANAGATWSAPVRVDDALPDDAVDHLRPSLSVSSTGRLDLVWVDYRHSSSKRLGLDRQPGDVYYSYSLDAGKTWSANVRLSGHTAPLLFGAGNDYVTVVSSGNTARAAYAQDQNGNTLYEARLTTIAFH